MTTQAPTYTSRPSDGGLMITEEMIISHFMRMLQAIGRENCAKLLEDYGRLLNPFPGWARTRYKLEDILIAYANNQLQTQNCAPGELPKVLATDKAMGLWEKAQQAGYVDENYQPLISRSQAALLADAMAEQLGIRNNKWKVFEALWNRKYMRNDYNLALSQQQSIDFQDELKEVLEG